MTSESVIYESDVVRCRSRVVVLKYKCGYINLMVALKRPLRNQQHTVRRKWWDTKTLPFVVAWWLVEIRKRWSTEGE